jgi:hypothetical protein
MLSRSKHLSFESTKRCFAAGALWACMTKPKVVPIERIDEAIGGGKSFPNDANQALSQASRS